MQSRLVRYLSQKRPDLNSAAVAVLASLDHLGQNHPDLVEQIGMELRKQRGCLKLIASENYSSYAVQLASGNLLTDKYAEGTPGHRFYAGCTQVDKIESCAVDTAKELFGADHAYVQPHSGSDANWIAFWAVLLQTVELPQLAALGKKRIGEVNAAERELIRGALVTKKMLAMGIESGGHLTHGASVNISSKMMQAVAYEVDPHSHRLDYAQIRLQALHEQPQILLAGASSYPRLIDFAKMREIADEVGATLIVDMAHIAGLVAGKVLQGVHNPIPFGSIVTSTTHKTLRGARGGLILCDRSFQEVIDRGCPLVQGGPLPHMMAAKLVSFREALDPGFSHYAQQVIANAQALAQQLIRLNTHLYTGGTDTHLLVIDVSKSFGLTGRQAELILDEAQIATSRNMLPQDPNGPWYTSGIRLGTPALTTRGLRESHMQEIGSIIVDLLSQATRRSGGNGPSRTHYDLADTALDRARSRVKELLADFPLYPELGE